jgi:hypothetical protein
MLILTNLPLYFKCFFFDKRNKKVVVSYKIDSTGSLVSPYQLFKRFGEGPTGWMHLSIYASLYDSLGTLLKELFNEELSDEIYRGKAVVDSAAILEKVNNGERTVALYDEKGNQTFRMEYDINFLDLVQRKAHPRMQKRSRKIGVQLG